MFQSFLGAKFGYLPMDPDIFERLLRGLQELPGEAVAEALLSAQHGPLLDAAWNHLLDTRLEALTADGSIQRPELQGQLRLAARDFLRSWLQDLLDGPGLVVLQADSGDYARQLLEQLQAVLLAQVIRGGQPVQMRAAVEAARLLQQPYPEPRAALSELYEKNRSDELLLLLGLLPTADTEFRRGPPIARTYPLRDLNLDASNRHWLVEHAERRMAASDWLVILFACLLLATGWLLAMYRWKQRRGLLKRLGAVLLAPLLLVVAEAGLTLAGVAPLMDLRPSFNPNQVPKRLYTVRALEGEDHFTTADGRARQVAFPVDKKQGRWRIFVFGESSAHASYYPIEDGFPALLEHGLRARNPGQEVEVVNAGVGAALSDEIAHYAFEALEYQPDLVVLYLGNNDMTHFVAMAGFRGHSARTIALRYALDRSRVVRVISALLPESLKQLSSDHNPEGAYLDTDALSDNDRTFLLGLAERNARQNIERVVERAERVGAEVLIAIQAQNGDLCPGDRAADSSSGCFPETLHRIATAAGASSGVSVVDVPAALRHHAGGVTSGVAGEDYFYDSIHPTRLGHAVIARALVPAAEELLKEPGKR